MPVRMPSFLELPDKNALTVSCIGVTQYEEEMGGRNIKFGPTGNTNPKLFVFETKFSAIQNADLIVVHSTTSSMSLLDAKPLVTAGDEKWPEMSKCNKDSHSIPHFKTSIYHDLKIVIKDHFFFISIMNKIRLRHR